MLYNISVVGIYRKPLLFITAPHIIWVFSIGSCIVTCPLTIIDAFSDSLKFPLNWYNWQSYCPYRQHMFCFNRDMKTVLSPSNWCVAIVLSPSTIYRKPLLFINILYCIKYCVYYTACCRCLTVTNDFRGRLHVALLHVGEYALDEQQLFEFGGLIYWLFIFLLSLVQYDNTIMSFMNNKYP